MILRSYCMQPTANVQIDRNGQLWCRVWPSAVHKPVGPRRGIIFSCAGDRDLACRQLACATGMFRPFHISRYAVAPDKRRPKSRCRDPLRSNMSSSPASGTTSYKQGVSRKRAVRLCSSNRVEMITTFAGNAAGQNCTGSYSFAASQCSEQLSVRC